MNYAFGVLSLIGLILSSTWLDQKTFVDERDESEYGYLEFNDLKWMTENLRFSTEQSLCVDEESELCPECGEFYLIEEALNICPDGWRLPTKKEVKSLIKLDKKRYFSLTDTLEIKLCGRIDAGEFKRFGEQNTFWINAELESGNIDHWHTFKDKHEIHNHNVVEVKRQFPVRCVCELH